MDNLIKPIVGLGSPVLREICTEAENHYTSQDIISQLKETWLTLPNCAGIAAPQINSKLRMFIMVGENGTPYIVINPVIKKRRGKFPFQEGCMSIPKVYQRLEIRDDIIDVEFYDHNFGKVKKRIRGFESIVFQHELDHLNGILFIDHLSKEGREMIQERLYEIERGDTKTTYDMFFPGTDVTQIK